MGSSESELEGESPSFGQLQSWPVEDVPESIRTPALLSATIKHAFHVCICHGIIVIDLSASITSCVKKQSQDISRIQLLELIDFCLCDLLIAGYRLLATPQQTGQKSESILPVSFCHKLEAVFNKGRALFESFSPPVTSGAG